MQSDHGTLLSVDRPQCCPTCFHITPSSNVRTLLQYSLCLLAWPFGCFGVGCEAGADASRALLAGFCFPQIFPITEGDRLPRGKSRLCFGRRFKLVYGLTGVTRAPTKRKESVLTSFGRLCDLSGLGLHAPRDDQVFAWGFDSAAYPSSCYKNDFIHTTIRTSL